jgi:hypothetical protein
MRRLLASLIALLALAGSSTAAFATSPHFVSASGTINSDGTLTVSFKESGLGTNALINYTLTADAAATWVCVNKGGSNPSASNKTTESGPVSASGAFNSGKNGNVTDSLTTSLVNLTPPAGFCPSGQKLELASVSYTNVTLTDITNNVADSLGTISSGCLLPNVRGAC